MVTSIPEAIAADEAQAAPTTSAAARKIDFDMAIT
jgi:hypothetical protein